MKDSLMLHFVHKEVAEDVLNGSGQVLAAAGATLEEEDIDLSLIHIWAC